METLETKSFNWKRPARPPEKPSVVFQIAGSAASQSTVLVEKVRQGLDYSSVKILEQAYSAPRKEIATVLQIPVTTLGRRKRSGILHPDESDRVLRLARLKDKALAMMHGDNDAAIHWLKTPHELLSNETPFQHANTELGARDVEDLITRLQNGVFS